MSDALLAAASSGLLKVETTYGAAPETVWPGTRRVSVRSFHSAWQWSISTLDVVLLTDLAPTEAEAWSRAWRALGNLKPKETP